MLQGRTEKGFSVGFLDRAYLNKGPVALVRDENNQILGFISIMQVYDNQNTVSIDLMRLKPKSPDGLIDFVILSLIDWANDQGDDRFNMGMAPLAGMSRFASLSEKIAAQIFFHGHFIYHFQGLRKFKEKYTNIWEPKYLSYRRKSSLPFIMAHLRRREMKETCNRWIWIN